MRRLFFLVLLLCCLAYTSQPTVQYPPRPDAASLADQTPALVLLEKDETAWTFCSAVWVSQREILTAEHCTEAVADKTGRASQIDMPVDFSLHKEHAGVFKDPLRTHRAHVTRIDVLHDLALLRSDEEFLSHPVAMLAATSPLIGSDLWFMGHTLGLSWSLGTGIVAAYREADFAPVEGDKLGPFLQVQAPTVYKGNSGGGAFNDHGEICGIASFMLNAPGTLFYVHLDTIRTFLLR